MHLPDTHLFDASSPAVTGTLWLLVAFSVATWTILTLKFWSYRNLMRDNRNFLSAFWAARDLAGARESLAQQRGVLAVVARAGFDAHTHLCDAPHEQSLRRLGDRRELLEAALRAGMRNAQHDVEAGLTILASIGSTAPFVGLFGTVWGIMHALEGIGQAGTATLSVVAGPVGEALIATAIGIAVAVPAVLGYNWGLRRTRLVIAEMEDFAADFLRVLSARWPDKAQPARAPATQG